MENFEKSVVEEIKKLQENGPTEEEVATLKEIVRPLLKDQTALGGPLVGLLINYEAQGFDLDRILSYEEEVDAITPELLQKTAQEMFDTENYSCLTHHPKQAETQLQEAKKVSNIAQNRFDNKETIAEEKKKEL